MRSVVNMKTKFIYILTIICIIIASLSFYSIDSSMQRIHQHLDARWQPSSQNDEIFSTYLPVIQIETHGQKIPGTPITRDDGTIMNELSDENMESITVDFSLIDHQEGSNQQDDSKTVETYATVHYRGNSSRFFDKKSYSIHLIDSHGNENPQELVGMTSHNEWILNGPFLDRTYIRNYLCMNIAGEIMDYAPNVRYCELFVDGEYQGLYLLMESISYGEGRIEMNQTNDDTDITSFIVRWDRAGKGDYELNNYTYYTYHSDVSALDVRYPGKNTITDEKYDYINDQISHIEKILYSMSLWEEDANYTDYIDVESFAEYFIINEFFKNVDAGKFSTFYYKDVRGKVKTVVWDFNNCCDNYADYVSGKAGFTMQYTPWFSQLVKDESFVSLVVEKYHQFRKSYLSTDYLLQYIEETDKWLTDAIQRNDEIWGYVYDLENYNDKNFLIPVERNMQSHQEAVEQLKHYIEERGEWLDQHIESLYQYCSESKNANDMLR